ncbi:MAG: tRNA-dihydrouridine synthase [bacterium]
MSQVFWEKLKKPFFCLAPMADVTDAAFRQIICKYGKPDVFWTEFVSADGLASPGKDVLKNNLIFSKKEKPIVAQLFSAHPDKMREAAYYVALLGFDGIDINMGCPDRSIEKQGAGAAMMKDIVKAGKIIQAVKDGISDSKKNHTKGQARNISVSVKTRIGYNKNQIEEWIPFLLSCDIDALTIHARTRKEMSNVPARWEHVKRVVEIRNEMKVKTKIIGNGDIQNIKEGKKLAQETGCDGIMIGRGIFGNPWLFSGKTPSIKEKLKVMVEHTKLFEKILGKYKNFAIMKKHFKAYVNGFDGAKELRVKLMDAKNAREVEKIVKDFSFK